MWLLHTQHESSASVVKALRKTINKRIASCQSLMSMDQLRRSMSLSQFSFLTAKVFSSISVDGAGGKSAGWFNNVCYWGATRALPTIKCAWGTFPGLRCNAPRIPCTLELYGEITHNWVDSIIGYAQTVSIR